MTWLQSLLLVGSLFSDCGWGSLLFSIVGGVYGGTGMIWQLPMLLVIFLSLILGILFMY